MELHQDLGSLRNETCQSREMPKVPGQDGHVEKASSRRYPAVVNVDGVSEGVTRSDGVRYDAPVLLGQPEVVRHDNGRGEPG